MGISYSTAKWLVGHQAIPTSLSYADLLQRRRHPSSSTLQPSSMACSPLPTCWTFTTRTYPSGARCLSSLAASSSPSSFSSSHGSTAYTSLILRSQSSAPSWIKLVGSHPRLDQTPDTRLTTDCSRLRALLHDRQYLHRQCVCQSLPALDHWLTMFSVDDILEYRAA